LVVLINSLLPVTTFFVTNKGEFPKSKPSIFFPPLSPSISLFSACHLIADSFNKSKSANTSIESAPFFKAQEIVVVALKTSMTTAISGIVSGTSFAT
jgi:uncharacterized membrane protein